MADSFDELTQPVDRRRFRLALNLGIGLVLALCLGMTGWSIYRDYRAAWDQEQHKLAALSRALEGYTNALLQQSYQSLRVCAERVVSENAWESDAALLAILRDAIRYDPVSSYLFARVGDHYVMIDSGGRQVTIESALAHLGDIERLPGYPVIGHPLTLPGVRGQMLPLLIDAQGRGQSELQIGALISMERFAQLLQRLELGTMNGGLVAIDGTVLYRAPLPERYVGTSIRKNSPIRAYLDDSWRSYVRGNNIDGVDTLYAMSPLPNFPVRALIGETVSDFREPWLRRSTYIALLITFSLLALALAGRKLLALATQISESEQFHRRLFADVNDGILLMSNDHHIRAANRAAARMFAVGENGALKNRSLAGLSTLHQPDGTLSRARADEFCSSVLNGDGARQLEWRFQREGGQGEFDCELNMSLFRWRDEDQLLAVFHDVTEHRRDIAELAYQANHDSLTRLPNRYWLTRHIDAHIAHHPERLFAVLILDLNRFKEVNDTLGHQYGDKVLIEVGQRLQQWLREQSASIARLGGDEMAITFAARDEAAIHSMCRGVTQVLSFPVLVGGVHMELSASIGVALYPAHGSDAGDLLRCADIAMYRAKHLRQDYAFYRSSEDKYTPDRLALHTQLGRAIRRGNLELYYQPKIQLRDGTVIGYEALLRWPRKNSEMLQPGEFIPLAENTELIHPLTDWVLNAALRQLQQWQRQGLTTRLAINISTNNLRNPNFIREVKSILEQYRIEPGLIELEVTESTLMVDPELGLRCLHDLRRLGVLLSIDDFGTGYSSLAYLKQLPVQLLKIDRSFVSAMLRSASDELIVQSTITLAHSFDLQVVAEGVEDKATATALARMGCDITQGYYFGKPVPAGQISTRPA